MIAYIRGKVLYLSEESVVIENNGIGYEVICSGSALSAVQANRLDAELYTHMQVREDGITLYGFTSPAEKKVFMKLITVSGVGPKLAITILSEMKAEDVTRCIVTADVRQLTRIKGLGKKTAEKIVLELHGKVSAGEILSASGELQAGVPQKQQLSGADEEAIAALEGLGFTRNESANAVRRAHEQGAESVEDIIHAALSGM